MTGARRSLVVVLAALVLVLQSALPHGAPLVHATQFDLRTAALAQAVGHAVETCHHGDGDGTPANDAAPRCPCVACHLIAAALPSAPNAAALGPPVAFAEVARYPQPPPHRVAAIFPASAGPRGPPRLV